MKLLSRVRIIRREDERPKKHYVQANTDLAEMEAAGTARRQKTTKRHKPKTSLRFPNLEDSRNAVVNSLAAASSQESYAHAINEFIVWY
jgi:hypothetical protein